MNRVCRPEMGHGHSHSHGEGNLKVAFFLNFTFTIIEIIGGLWTNSVAILADAVHDAGDSLSLGVAWYLESVSKRTSDEEYTYGYARFSVLGALITGAVLLAGLGFVLVQAVPRLLNPEDVRAPEMIAIAVAGVVFNGIAVLRLHGGASLNEKVASWHLLEDVLGWVAVLIGSLIMTFWDLPIIDPILSIGISLFILWNVFRNLRQVMRVFLQSKPEAFDLASFRSGVEALPGVLSTHHIHPWTLDGEHHVLTLHVVVEPERTAEQTAALKTQICGMLDPHEFSHVTIDVEREGDECASGHR